MRLNRSVAAFCRSRCPTGDRGGVAVYLAICVLPLLAIIGIAVDGGGKARAVERADALATEAARAGGQAIDPGQAIPGHAIVADPQAAQAAARSYLRATGTHGIVRVSPDGKSLTVTTHTTYRTKFLAAAGVDTLAVTGHGKATLLYGVDAPEEGP
ncbi:Tad domain-containing protein [Streptomyces sp. NA02950]|uniref:pilus assembly protein TadG-related protein n=1 Tax=Streptomyces sp. NA02950 TaxID=2742137 RepID=UPI001591C697|nr:pilus assembly protein TadG-related protein [Streptomyces sp. NA02950]QKV90410.1 Tad domain-containing protein [Streptomyces sp. NA02950]QKV97257.1 Tad domain-containing protein [Streptomyces sp. NA02950]